MIEVHHLLPSFELGGTETQLWKVSSQLPRDQVCQKVFAFGDGPLRQRFLENNIEAVLLGGGATGVGRFIREVWRQRPHLLHTHLYPCNQVGRVVGGLFPCCKVFGSDRCVDVYDGPLARFVDRCTFPLSVGTLVNSQSVKTFLVLVRGLPSERIAVVENGVSPSPELVRESRSQQDKLRILCVGRLVAQKGIRILLEALSKDGIRSRTWHLNVVGTGQEKERLRKLAASLDLSRKVSWLGEMENWTQVAVDSDLFVLPSLFEGLPNVILEAMERGLPVLSTDVGGACDLVQPGQTGWLVSPHEVGELTQALLDAFCSDLREMGRKGRARALHLFDLKRTAARTLQLYQKIVWDGGAIG